MEEKQNMSISDLDKLAEVQGIDDLPTENYVLNSNSTSVSDDMVMPVSVNNLNQMLDAMHGYLKVSYQGVLDTLMRSIVAHMIISSPEVHVSGEETLEQMYERMKKYPYLCVNPTIFNDYPFETFKIDHSSICRTLRAWKGLSD
jgi:hypothetical protein